MTSSRRKEVEEGGQHQESTPGARQQRSMDKNEVSSLSSSLGPSSGQEGGGGTPSTAQEQLQQHQLRLQQELSSHQAAVMHQLAASAVSADPEQFRNNSIACLRAKAQEHSAKMLGLSSSASHAEATHASLLLNSVSQLMRGSRMPHQDANGNTLHPHSHLNHAQDLVTSSDNSSSMF